MHTCNPSFETGGDRRTTGLTDCDLGWEYVNPRFREMILFQRNRWRVTEKDPMPYVYTHTHTLACTCILQCVHTRVLEAHSHLFLFLLLGLPLHFSSQCVCQHYSALHSAPPVSPEAGLTPVTPTLLTCFMVSLELRSDLKQFINRLQQTYRNPFKNSSTQSVLSYISPGGDGSI